jgi:hypothetical protein
MPSGGLTRGVQARADPTGGIVKKSDREIMEILEAYDLTGCALGSAAGGV